jgi:hypothetical protein
MEERYDRERRPEFDLEERTARFGEGIIAFVKQAPVNVITTPIISQLFGPAQASERTTVRPTRRRRRRSSGTASASASGKRGR